MTDKKLKELLIVIDNRYGRVRSKEDRIIDLKTCVQAFGMVPDEIVEKALYAAFAKCRFPNQIIVDWCEEIKKLQATVKPSANDLWGAGGDRRPADYGKPVLYDSRRAGNSYREAHRGGLQDPQC